MKTRNEVERLKTEWLRDPYWAIEDTRGFEEHRVELLAYRLDAEEAARQEHHDKIMAFATRLGTSFEVVDYIIELLLERELLSQQQIGMLLELS